MMTLWRGAVIAALALTAVSAEAGARDFGKRYLAERGLHWAANLISTFEQVRKA